MSKAERRRRKQENKRRAQERRYRTWRRVNLRRRLTVVLVWALVIALVATFATFLIGDDGESSATTSTSRPTTSTTLPAELAAVECTDEVPEAADSDKPTFDAPEDVIDEGVAYRATIETSCGDIVAELDPSVPDVSAAGVNNFVFLAGEDFFDGLTFHRVVGDFVIQGGDPEGTGRGGPGYQFGGADDVPDGITYEVGDLAYANSTGPETSGSQWFVVTGPRGPEALDPQASFIKFGTVVEGLEVAQRIEAFEEGDSQQPSRPVFVFDVTVEEA